MRGQTDYVAKVNAAPERNTAERDALLDSVENAVDFAYGNVKPANVGRAL